MLGRVGQDETIGQLHAREVNEWVLSGVRGLRKYSEGPGQYVSAPGRAVELKILYFHVYPVARQCST